MKPRFYLFCSLLFLIISCRTTQFDRTLPDTDSYPDFYIFTIQKSLYTFVDTLEDRVYKIGKYGNSILISTTKQEYNLNEYWIEKIDSSEHNFQMIPFYKKRLLKRLYTKKGGKKKRRGPVVSANWSWSFVPDWRKLDTLFLNINIIESNKVSCQLSYWLDTTKVFFETKGIINYDK